MGILTKTEKFNYNEVDYGTFNLEQIKGVIEDVNKWKGESYQRVTLYPPEEMRYYESVHDETLKNERREIYEKSSKIKGTANIYLSDVYKKKPQYTQEELTQMLGLMEKFKDPNFSRNDLEEMIQKEKDKVLNIDNINPELTLNTRLDVLHLDREVFSYKEESENVLLAGIRGSDLEEDTKYKEYGIDKDLTVDEKAKLMIQFQRQTKDRINILKRRNEILESSQEYAQVKAEIKRLQNMQVSPEQKKDLNDKVNMLRYKASSMCRLAQAQATIDIVSNNKELYEDFDLEAPNIKSTLNVDDYTMDEITSEHKKMREQTIKVQDNARFSDDTAYTLSVPFTVIDNEKSNQNEFRESLKVSKEEQEKNRMEMEEQKQQKQVLEKTELEDDYTL